MPTGKPNFNLNSYGIKYLSKEEVQEFLEKRTQGESIRSQGETRTRPLGTSGKPMDSGARQAGQHRGSTAGLKQGEFTPSLAGRNQIDATINTPKPEAEKPSTPTSSTISAPNAAGDKKLQGGTRSQFMSREDTTPKSNYAKQIAGDIKEARGKVDESGIVSRGGDQSVSATSQGKKVPAHRIKPLYGKNPDGSDEDDSEATPPPKPKAQSLGSTIGTGKQTEKKQEKTEIKQNTTGKGKKGLKQLPKHTGDAPKGTKSEKQLVDGRNTQVGVGSRAHKKLEKDPQGELTSSQKPVDTDKPDGRKVDLNTQHRSSQGVQNHNTRSRENMKYYNDDQKAAYNKIDPKDRTAQSKFHDEQDKKYGKSVNTPKKLSSAGQAIKDKLKKSNDIITDMNIMKLDLMKDGIEGGGKNIPKEWDNSNIGNYSGRSNNLYQDRIPQTKEGQAADERGMNAKERDYSKRLYGGDYHHGRVPREHRDKPHAKPPVTKPYKGKKPDSRVPENKLSEKERTKIETTGLREAGLNDRHIPRGDACGEFKRVPDKERSSSGKGSPSDLREKSAETIFKAISLKLDLMKTDYSSPTDIDMKDVYEKKRVKEVEAKHNTSCPHCKQTLPKYKPEPIDD